MSQNEQTAQDMLRHLFTKKIGVSVIDKDGGNTVYEALVSA
jgi:hypothetical protein